MLEKEIDHHKGCPNRHHCEKDEKKCCYLVRKECLLDADYFEELL